MTKVIFKVIGFTGSDDCDCILEGGKKIIIDPFVGCAFEYEQKDHLVGKWWEAEGDWFSGYGYEKNKKSVLLLREGTLNRFSKND